MKDVGGLPTPAGSNQRRVDELAVDDWVSTVPTLAVASAAPAVWRLGAPAVCYPGYRVCWAAASRAGVCSPSVCRLV
jgi:hypothetical protein